MTKAEFLQELEQNLAPLPREERQRQLDYYAELLDDMLEDGIAEAEAVSRLGSVQALAEDILAEAPADPTPQKAQPRPGFREMLHHLLGTNGASAAAGSGNTQAGDTTLPADGLHSIDLQWTSGLVEILPYEGGQIQISERAARPLQPQERMLVSQNSGTLSIRYAENRSRWNMPVKSLKLLLPQPFAAALRTVTVNTVSAESTLEDFRAQALHFRSVSGDLEARGLRIGQAEVGSLSGDLRLEGEFGSLQCSSTSGDLELSGQAETFQGRTVSGELEARIRQAGQIDFATTSGDLSFSGGAKTLNLRSISGDVEFQSDRCPERLDAESTSGDVRLSLPPESEFTLRYRTVSGDLRSDFPVLKQDGVYRCGSGGAELRVKTTSGDLAVRTSRQR